MSVSKNEPILVVGAGAFGISTVYHLLEAGFTDITVVDKDDEVPSRFSAANDINKIVRAEYEDDFYTDLTIRAIEQWKTPLFAPHFHQTGFLHCVSGNAPKEALDTLNRFRASAERNPLMKDKVVDIKGRDTILDEAWQLQGPLPGWHGYLNKFDGYAHSGNAVKGLFDVVRKRGVKFILGKDGAVAEIIYEKTAQGKKSKGIKTATGRFIPAGLVIVAAGAAASRVIPEIGTQLVAKSWSVAHVHLTEDEVTALRGIPVTYARDLGFFFEPDPVTRLLKLCPMGGGYINTDPTTGVSHAPGTIQESAFLPPHDEAQLRNFLGGTGKTGNRESETQREIEKEMGSMVEVEKPHAVCIPYPAQGHINPMLKLAKLLHHKGFHITFVNTEFNHRRLLKARGPDSVKGLPDFRFETIPDGLPPSDADATQDIPALCVSTRKNCLAPFRDLLAKLNDTAKSNVPPVTCIVADGVMSFTLEAAQELGIPDVLFWTTSVCGFMGYAHYPQLIQRGLTPLKDASYLTNRYLETPIDWIPGMTDIRMMDLPSFVRTTDPDDIMLEFPPGEVKRAHRASAIIFNTFDAFESEVLNAASSMFPAPIYSIGPLHSLLNQTPIEEGLKAIRTSLWKEETKCIDWLDSKAPKSIVYVNFGSITVMTPQQMVEFAWGLANSKQSFLWIIRPDLVTGDSAVLPAEFLTVTKERGMLSSWCPQEEVLNHPSIGGFLTHSGWNSTLESISGGIPMICWPFFAEQQTNCRYACTKWCVGMEIDNNVKRDEVEKLMWELMEGEKGEEMKKRAMEWKKSAEEATAEAGSSYLNLDKMVHQVLKK